MSRTKYPECQANGGFAMNQNHLHLNVNITNAPGFSHNNSNEQTRIESRLSGNEFSTFEQNDSKRMDLTSKNSDSSKVTLKRNNIMYTPLTISGAFK